MTDITVVIIAVYKLWLRHRCCYYCCLQTVTDITVLLLLLFTKCDWQPFVCEPRIKVYCSIVAKPFMNSPIKMHVTKRLCLNLEGWLRHKSFLYSLQYFKIILNILLWLGLWVYSAAWTFLTFFWTWRHGSVSDVLLVSLSRSHVPSYVTQGYWQFFAGHG